MIVTAFKIHSDKSTHEWNESTLWGELFIEIDGCNFPCKKWTDIISSVMDMWLFNLNNLLKSDKHGEGSFYFMDGPFFFNATCNRIDNVIEIWLFEYDKLFNETPYRLTFTEFISVILAFVDQLTTDNQIAGVNEIKKLKKRSKHIRRLMYFKSVNTLFDNVFQA